MATLKNVWHRRQVAESSSKACMICFRPSTTVLITPDNKDFFYVCPSHLNDRGFCSPIIDEVAVAEAKKKKEKQEELEREKEKLKKEFKEKEKKKKDKEKEKAKDDKKEDTETKDEKAKDKDTNSKVQDTEEVKSAPAEEEVHRIFQLQKSFYQMRVDRLKANELAKRNRDRLKNPAIFPSVPSGDI
ncbi:MAG: hypothetical protein M1814_006257 [Vezdaea aestivalis]|nr:MAG: hypothetical protein M1814_006257 [Vezdaea aestivalis]